jgi:hypothetical protein
MAEKFATVRGEVSSGFLDLDRIRNALLLVSPVIPQFAPGASREIWRTAESGH